MIFGMRAKIKQTSLEPKNQQVRGKRMGCIKLEEERHIHRKSLCPGWVGVGKSMTRAAAVGRTRPRWCWVG